MRGVCTLTSGAAAVGVAAAWMPSAAQAATAVSVGVEVQSLRAQAETATQQYDQATTGLALLQQRVNSIQDQTSTLRQQVDQYNGSLGRLAEAQYRGGGVDPTMQLLFAQQPEQFLQRAVSLNAVGRGESVELKSVLAQQQQLAQFRAEADSLLAEQVQDEQQAAAARGRILAEYQQAQQLVGRLTAGQQWALDDTGVPTADQIAAVPTATGARRSRSTSPSPSWASGTSGEAPATRATTAPAWCRRRSRTWRTCPALKRRNSQISLASSTAAGPGASSSPGKSIPANVNRSSAGTSSRAAKPVSRSGVQLLAAVSDHGDRGLREIQSTAGHQPEGLRHADEIQVPIAEHAHDHAAAAAIGLPIERRRSALRTLRTR